jgi:hypothetical protein
VGFSFQTAIDCRANDDNETRHFWKTIHPQPQKPPTSWPT